MRNAFDLFLKYQEALAEIQRLTRELAGKQAELETIVWVDSHWVMGYLHVSKKTLQRYRNLRLIAYTHVGNKMLYKRSDVEQLLRDNYFRKLP